MDLPHDPHELERLLERAREWLASLTPAERDAHFKAQKESYVRSEMAWGDEGTRPLP